MKIVVNSWEDGDRNIREELTINGKKRQYVGPCEPEDAIIGRDLVSCSEIASFMWEAHKAGAAGEPWEFELIEKEP